jgi:K+-sensing histidine kinase KdpD
MTSDPFDFDHLMSGIVATVVVGFALFLVPTLVAVPVLVALAYICGRLGGRDAGLGSVATGSLMFGYAITEPHFVWSIADGRDEILLVILFCASMVTAELGARRRIASLSRR